jgi:uncharacterized protein YuzE
MRVTYDPEADAAFVYLTKIGAGGAASSQMLDRYIDQGAIIAVFDHDEHLVGIEVLGASRVLPREVLDAERPGSIS